MVSFKPSGAGAMEAFANDFLMVSSKPASKLFCISVGLAENPILNRRCLALRSFQEVGFNGFLGGYVINS
jgi:hypothetical protein